MNLRPGGTLPATVADHPRSGDVIPIDCARLEIEQRSTSTLSLQEKIVFSGTLPKNGLNALVFAMTFARWPVRAVGSACDRASGSDGFSRTRSNRHYSRRHRWGPSLLPVQRSARHPESGSQAASDRNWSCKNCKISLLTSLGCSPVLGMASRRHGKVWRWLALSSTPR
jgi:hypothetical protein